VSGSYDQFGKAALRRFMSDSATATPTTPTEGIDTFQAFELYRKRFGGFNPLRDFQKGDYLLQELAHADVEIGRHATCRSAKLQIFFTPLVFLSRIRYTILVSFGMQVAKTPPYRVMRRLPLFVALCDHNPPMLQTGRQTDRRTSCWSHSATC